MARTVPQLGRDRRKLERTRRQAQFHEDLPVELDGLILAQLEPATLLELARTSRSWRRRLLAGSEARKTWEVSFQRCCALGLPPAPPELSPPRYAALVFDDVCDHCGEEGAASFWILARCLCDDCQRTQLRSIRELAKDIQDARALYIIPRVSSDVVEALQSGTGSYVYVPDLDAAVKLLGDCRDYSSSGFALAKHLYEGAKERETRFGKLAKEVGEFLENWPPDDEIERERLNFVYWHVRLL